MTITQRSRARSRQATLTDYKGRGLDGCVEADLGNSKSKGAASIAQKPDRGPGTRDLHLWEMRFRNKEGNKPERSAIDTQCRSGFFISSYQELLVGTFVPKQW